MGGIAPSSLTKVPGGMAGTVSSSLRLAPDDMVGSVPCFAADAALHAAACPSGVRVTHSAASSAVAK